MTYYWLAVFKSSTGLRTYQVFSAPKEANHREVKKFIVDTKPSEVLLVDLREVFMSVLDYELKLKV